jgi:hypothetical protein
MVAKVKELAMDGRNQVNRIMRRAVVVVTDYVVLVCAVGSVAKVCVCEVGHVYLGTVNPLEANQLRFVLAKRIYVIIRRFAGFDGRC